VPPALRRVMPPRTAQLVISGHPAVSTAVAGTPRPFPPPTGVFSGCVADVRGGCAGRMRTRAIAAGTPNGRIRQHRGRQVPCEAHAHAHRDAHRVAHRVAHAGHTRTPMEAGMDAAQVWPYPMRRGTQCSPLSAVCAVCRSRKGLSRRSRRNCNRRRCVRAPPTGHADRARLEDAILSIGIVT